MMEIQKIQVLKGPNIWSIRRHNLIQMRLDLKEMEQRPSNKVDGFAERLEKMFPSMFSHRCSVGEPGGFFQRVQGGTWMGHIIEHVALEIQTLAGMDTGFGRTRETKTPGVYNVVFSYIEEQVGVFAAKSAVAIVEAIVDNKEYDLEGDIQRMREIRDATRLGPSTGGIVDEAVSRGIPYIRLNKHSLVQLGYGVNKVRFRATITEFTSDIAVEIACDKEDTKELLEQHNIPIPKGDIIRRESSLEDVIKRIGYPLVFKPISGNHGKGATINVNDDKAAFDAFNYARTFASGVVVERFITGYDFRVLVIDNKMVAAAKREPAHVVGDGKSTIEELVIEVNKDPRRGYGHENVLTEIDLNSHTLSLLEKYGFTTETVIPKGEKCYLKSTANLSTGGTSVDVTDLMHPANVFLCERISRIIGLDICGIDIMAPDLSTPIDENGGVVLEVNAAPGFRMHLAPSEGLPRNVAGHVVDMLYPPGKPSRIPIIAVTGTNGKTTTTRLLAHIIKNTGKRVGFTTSDGIYIQNRCLSKGDTTGPKSAGFVLKDPTVEYAILETARGGILRAGLGYSRADAAIMTNLDEDHLGLRDIETMDDLARVKEVVMRSVKRDGHAILNAENEYCVKIARNLECNIGYFAIDENNEVMANHCSRGGVGAVYENGYITIKKGDWKIRVAKATDVPLTFGGRAIFNIYNVLAATLAAYLQEIKIEDIRFSLTTFIPSSEVTPGRMNLFEFRNFKLVLDYAHNPAGLQGIKTFLEQTEAVHKIGIITGTGDRRDQDIKEIGRISALTFDHIIIRHEKHRRGRDESDIDNLLIEGMNETKPGISYEIIPDEMDAIRASISQADKKEHSFVVVLVDDITRAIQTVKDEIEKETKSTIIA
ncbi:MAG: cyanophycin synthetase [Sphingobacteriales bacterium]|jgi:cyanophycin synthetase